MKINIRAEENAFLLFDRESARTAYLNEEEFEALKRWADGEENGFASRLIRMGLLEEGQKAEIREKAVEAARRKAPYRSFCAPESLHIELTACCPLHCPQCYQRLTKTELSWEFLEDNLRQAAELGVFQIAFGGGEPLIYPHLEAAVSLTAQLGMACSITTSGWELTKERLQKLIGLGLNHMQVSLGGSTKEIHSRSREGFEITLQALSLLQKEAISYGVNWVARMDNIDDFPAFVQQMQAYGVGNINILRYKPAAGEEYFKLRLTKEKLLQLEANIRKVKGIAIRVDSAFSCLLCHLNKQAGAFCGCGAGRRFLAIDANGYYRPCSHIAWKEQGKKLKEIWYHSEHLEAFRTLGEQIGQPCKTCRYLESCGSCRAVVLAQDGDFWSGDPECCFFE